MLEASLVCKNCGLETIKHDDGCANSEYEDIARGKGAAKMKKEAVKDKLGGISPMKTS